MVFAGPRDFDCIASVIRNTKQTCTTLILRVVALRVCSSLIIFMIIIILIFVAVNAYKFNCKLRGWV